MKSEQPFKESWWLAAPKVSVKRVTGGGGGTYKVLDIQSQDHNKKLTPTTGRVLLLSSLRVFHVQFNLIQLYLYSICSCLSLDADRNPWPWPLNKQQSQKTLFYQEAGPGSYGGILHYWQNRRRKAEDRGERPKEKKKDKIIFIFWSEGSIICLWNFKHTNSLIGSWETAAGALVLETFSHYIHWHKYFILIHFENNTATTCWRILSSSQRERPLFWNDFQR